MKTIRLLGFISLAVLCSFTSKAEWAYFDDDNDGWGRRIREITPAQVATFLSRGWKVSTTKPGLDCNDADNTVWRNEKLWIDNDGDKRSTGYTQLCIGATAPAGYVLSEDLLGTSDCDDNDPTVWRNIRIHNDADGDRHVVGAGVVACIGASAPAGFTIFSDALGYSDCDDNNNAVWRTIPLLPDADNDGYAGGTTSTMMCVGAVPSGYVDASLSLGLDCDDNNGSIWRNVGLLPDNDGDFYVRSTAALEYFCIGNTPPDGYIFPAQRLGQGDCNDNNPTLWRGVCLVPVNGEGKRTGPNVQGCIGATVPAGFMTCIDYQNSGAELTEDIPAPAAFAVTVYPNPATSRVFITPDREMNSRVEVKLLDPYGRVVKMISSPNLFKGQNLSMQVGDLKPGIYRITIQNGTSIISRTISVKM